MYKLTYFKAVNIAGFVSGLGKKTVELDLRPLIHKDIIVIPGDNATGKSTFLSLVHPVHNPTNKKNKFIVEGKEGLLLREYSGDDGSIILTKNVFTPKKDGHDSKLFFKIIYPNGEEKELNPNGNVTSYYNLLNIYLGINDDFIKFAAYNDEMKGIVDMTASERKKHTTTLIPNTSRFEIAFNIINEKYKEVRNIIKNISQKITKLKDETTLKSELKRLEELLNRLTEEREELIRKNSKYEGRLKEISGDSDIEELVKSYKENNKVLSDKLNIITKLQNKLESIIDSSDLEDDNIDTSLYDTDIETVSEKIVKINTLIPENKNNISRLKNELYALESSLEEYNATLYSLQVSDLAELEELRKEYLQRIDELKYSKMKDVYKNLDYNECMGFMSNLELVLSTIFAVYENNGQLFTDYLNNQGLFNEYKTEDDIIREIADIKQSVDNITKNIMELDIKSNTMLSYKYLKDRLEMRPNNCEIDDCPFIVDALKWTTIESKLNSLHDELSLLKNNVSEYNTKLDNLYKALQTINDAKNLHKLISANSNLFLKYFNTSIEDIYNTLKKDQIPEYLNLDKLKDIAAVLSEKELYNEIMGNKLPDIDRTMQLVKDNSKNIELFRKEKFKISVKIGNIRTEISRLEMRGIIYNKNMERYTEKLNRLTENDKLIKDYKTEKRNYKELKDKISVLSGKISTILEFMEKIDANKKEIKSLEKEIGPLLSDRDKIKFELNQLIMLNIEKKQVEKDYILLDLMKYIIQPGKSIWNKIMDIYMFDVKNVANQLLSNTFNGNLYLEDFNIDDKAFIIPYVYNGVGGMDISYASSSQKTAISTGLSLAILSKLVGKYGILTYDEVDKDLAPTNKEIFIDILAKQTKYIGISQNFVITHNPEYYEAYDIGYILFPRHNIRKLKDKDYIEV